MLNAAERSTKTLELSALSLSAPSGHALLRSASVRIAPGLIALSGANGSGKSTLLRAIALLHPVDSGTISMGNVEAVERQRRAWLSQLVFMPQTFPVYSAMTAREFLEYSLMLRGSSRRHAKSLASHWLETVGLDSVADKLCGTYSQGMRQRLGLAYALQLDVPLYLLDEPLAGIDAGWRDVLLDLMAEGSSRRIVLVSTHHVGEMLDRGASVITLARGQLKMASAVLP